jgi:hypothetical protein
MPTREELIALLAEPGETLTIEHKSWLDLNERHGQATLAKAAIALANHGGGIVIFGMRGDDAVAGLESHDRPEGLRRYRQEDINAGINRFAEPHVHCELLFARHPTSNIEHAFVVVPGSAGVPVMSRRECAGVISQQRCYIRKPGPRSEEPFSSEEWRSLLDRCIRAGREDMLEAIRLIVQGHAGAAPAQAAVEALENFAAASIVRWETLTEALPADDEARMPHGRYELTFEISDAPPATSLIQLRERMATAGAVRHTGWGHS